MKILKVLYCQFVIGLLMFLSCSSLEAIPLGENLLPNGNMEIDKDENGFPDEWGIMGKTGEADAIWDSSVARSGRYSIKLNLFNDKSNVSIVTWIKVKPNTSYRMSAWFKVPEGQQETIVEFLVKGFTEDRSKGRGWEPIPQCLPGKDWTKMIRIIDTHEEVAWLRISAIFRKQKGTCWIDDVRLEEAENLTATGDRYSNLMIRKGQADYRFKEIERALFYFEKTEVKSNILKEKFKYLMQQSIDIEKSILKLRTMFGALYGGTYYLPEKFYGKRGSHLQLDQTSLSEITGTKTNFTMFHTLADNILLAIESQENGEDKLKRQIIELAQKNFSWFKNYGIKEIYSPAAEQQSVPHCLKEISENIYIGLYNQHYWYPTYNPLKYDNSQTVPDFFGGCFGQKPDEYNFDQLDYYIKHNKKRGRKVIMRLVGGHNLQMRPPGWLEKKYGDEIYLKDQFGRVSGISGTYGVHLNIWHPGVRDFVRNWLRAVGTRYRNERNILAYILMTEPELTAFSKEKVSQEQELLLGDSAETAFIGCQYGRHEGGYNKSAVDSFRRYLKEIYGDIADLNKDWDSRYKSFEEISSPVDYTYFPRKRNTPLIYHFEKFRRESLTDFFRMCYQTLKSVDPNHPVSVGLWGHGRPELYKALDTRSIVKEACDMFSQHATSKDYYALNRFIKKPLWVDESGGGAYLIPGRERMGMTDASEKPREAACRTNLWMELIWGAQQISVDGNTPSLIVGTILSNRSNELRYGARIMPRFTRAIKAVQNDIIKYKEILLNTKVAEPEIALLFPSLSLMSDYFPPDVFWPWPQRGGLRGEIENVRDWLEKKHYDFFLVPEEEIVNGNEDINKFKVIILPYVLYFPEGLSEKLLKYVKSGGTLISIGPAGVYDKYGREDLRLLSKILGKVKFENKGYKQGIIDSVIRAGDTGGDRVIIKGWRWDLDIKRSKIMPHVFFQFQEGSPALLKASYGKGSLFLSAFSFLENPDFEGILIQMVSGAIPVRKTWAEGDCKIELVVRKDLQDREYLFIRNKDFRKQATADIFIRGRYPQILDLTIGSGLPVPIEPEKEITKLPVLLPAGETVILFLGKNISNETKYQLKRDSVDTVQENLANLKSRIDKFSGPRVSKLRAERYMKRAEIYLRIYNNNDKAIVCIEKARLELLNPLPATNATIHRINRPIKVDGDISDWVGKEIVKISGSNSDLGGSFSLAHDKKYLYIMLNIKDQILFNHEIERRFWDGDSVEVYIDVWADESDPYEEDDFHYVFSLGGNATLWKKRFSKSSPQGVVIASKKNKSGYIIEAAISLKELHIKPVSGFISGMNFRILDCDAMGGKCEKELMWYKTSTPYKSTHGWGKVLWE